MKKRELEWREVKPRGLGRPFVSPYISICADCAVCTCAWAYGRPVRGWTAEPSALYPGGWRVRECPEFVPMRRRRRR